MRTVNDFHPDDSSKLKRELSQLESNAARETDSIRAGFEPLTRVRSYSFIADGIVAVRFGEQLSVDTSLGNVTAVLPAVGSDNFGRRATIIKRKGANVLSVVCADSAALLNGAAFPLALTAVGPVTFFCDAAGYYK